MSGAYRITPEQEAWLKKFTCERLSADKENLKKIDSFTVRREGQGLLGALKHSGWGKDLRGSTAYYVIKNEKGEIVMFFSLKCGVLFDPFHVQAFIDAYQDTEVQKLWKPFRRYTHQWGWENQNWDLLKTRDQAAAGFIEIRDRIGHPEWVELVGELQQFDSLMEDRRTEQNQLMVRVKQDHSAIQLVEFCADQAANSKWKQEDTYGMMPQLMGETLFWWFIVPKMLEIGQLIGSEYVYLFAADSSSENTLTKYYERLHFRKLSKLGTVKPYYDLNCAFMGKRLRTLHESLPRMDDLGVDPDVFGLDHYREEFLDNFNQNRNAADNI